MTKIYYDAEFTGLHRGSSLISIGLVSESGTSFYAEFTDYNKEQIDEWLNENVIANLRFREKISPDGLGYLKTTDKPPHPVYSASPHLAPKLYSVEMCKSADDIRVELKKWLQSEYEAKIPKETLQFYVDCYAYDWVLLVDLLTYGSTALEMPKYIHYIPIDLSTLLWTVGEDPDINRVNFSRIISATNEGYPQHNALFDAQVIRYCFNRILKSCHELKVSPYGE